MERPDNYDWRFDPRRYPYDDGECIIFSETDYTLKPAGWPLYKGYEVDAPGEVVITFSTFEEAIDHLRAITEREF